MTQPPPPFVPPSAQPPVPTGTPPDPVYPPGREWHVEPPNNDRFQPFMPARGRNRAGLWTVALVAGAVVVLAAVGWVALRVTSHSSPSKTGAAAPRPTTSAPATAPAVPTRVAFQSASGHFTARFAQRPVVSRYPATFGPYKFRVYLAIDRVSATAVEAVSFSPSMPRGAISRFQRGALHGAGAGTNSTVVDQKALRFRGHPAMFGRFKASSGVPMSVLCVNPSLSRAYVLLGPSGPRFAALKANFRATR